MTLPLLHHIIAASSRLHHGVIAASSHIHHGVISTPVRTLPGCNKHSYSSWETFDLTLKGKELREQLRRDLGASRRDLGAISAA